VAGIAFPGEDCPVELPPSSFLVYLPREKAPSSRARSRTFPLTAWGVCRPTVSQRRTQALHPSPIMPSPLPLVTSAAGGVVGILPLACLGHAHLPGLSQGVAPRALVAVSRKPYRWGSGLGLWPSPQSRRGDATDPNPDLQTRWHLAPWAVLTVAWGPRHGGIVGPMPAVCPRLHARPHPHPHPHPHLHPHPSPVAEAASLRSPPIGSGLR
jgi:hypothetical protein